VDRGKAAWLAATANRRGAGAAVGEPVGFAVVASGPGQPPPRTHHLLLRDRGGVAHPRRDAARRTARTRTPVETRGGGGAPPVQAASHALRSGGGPRSRPVGKPRDGNRRAGLLALRCRRAARR